MVTKRSMVVARKIFGGKANIELIRRQDIRGCGVNETLSFFHYGIYINSILARFEVCWRPRQEKEQHTENSEALDASQEFDIDFGTVVGSLP